MGKWIAAFLLLIFFVAPTAILLTRSGQQFAMQLASWLFVRSDVAALGQKVFDDVRVRDFRRVLTPQVRATLTKPQLTKVQAELSQLADQFPNEKPLSVKIVGGNTVLRAGARTYTLTYEYEFPQRWVLASAVLVRNADDVRISNLHAQPMAESLEQSNALTLVGKTRTHYLFAGAAALIFMFSVGSAYACLFTPMARRKWLWVIFVMLGFMSLNLNWTTGQLSYNALAVIAPAARAWTEGGFYSPWIVQIGLPLGAIVFWLRRRALMRAPAQRGDQPAELSEQEHAVG